MAQSMPSHGAIHRISSLGIEDDLAVALLATLDRCNNQFTSERLLIDVVTEDTEDTESKLCHAKAQLLMSSSSIIRAVAPAIRAKIEREIREAIPPIIECWR